MLDGLRAELDALGLTAADVQLPGEHSAVAPLEGALRLQVEDGRYALATVDYGTAYRLGAVATEAEAREMVLAYVSRPLPAVGALARAQLDRLVGRWAGHYPDLRNRALAAGPSGIVIDLPPDLPIDRIGALDGVHTYPINTPFEHRSLPPDVLRPESRVHRFFTSTDLRVGATITPPWFGRPGGGLRYTLQQPGLGLRDLVVSGALRRIQVVDREDAQV